MSLIRGCATARAVNPTVVDNSGKGPGRFTLTTGALLNPQVFRAGFVQVIAPGAFDEVADDPDVGLDWQSRDFPLGHTRSDTLDVRWADGLFTLWVSPPPAKWATGLRAFFAAGGISGVEVEFSTPEDGSGERWEHRDGGLYRVVTRVSRLDRLTLLAPGPVNPMGLGLELLDGAQHAGWVVAR